ncbi:unnamed protein product, partial [Heterosigma akashiwo]
DGGGGEGPGAGPRGSCRAGPAALRPVPPAAAVGRSRGCGPATMAGAQTTGMGDRGGKGR